MVLPNETKVVLTVPGRRRENIRGGRQSLDQTGIKEVVELTGGYRPSRGRTRLDREFFGGRFRPREVVKLREVAAVYELRDESVLQAFSEFLDIGLVELSGNISAIVHEAFDVRATIEEIAGQTAAGGLKSYAVELHHQLAGMRAAADDGDLESCAEHDGEFHRAIIKASQNNAALCTWDTLGGHSKKSPGRAHLLNCRAESCHD